MSSTVLARTHRPRDFEALVGQTHVVQALANALTQQRLHHAYLFTGTRGVGKTTVSRILAKSLNCTGPDGSGGITARPCGACPACRDIDAGRFIDYVELDAASNRGVEDITQLLDQAVYKPVVGRFKIYMIDEVHMLSGHAFNAMLKTLEEPPDYLKFVLATTDPQKVPATVLSRCLQFNLRPMAPPTIVDHLLGVLGAEGVAAEPAALKLIARAARGSMRDALSLADQAIAYGAGRVEEGHVQRMLGAVDRGHAVRIVEAVAAGDGAALIGAVDGLRELGLSASGALEEVAVLLQEMAVLQVVPGEGSAEAEAAARLAPLLPADETQLLYSIVVNGRAELPLAPDEYSGLLMVLLRMLAFPPREDRFALDSPPTPVSAAAERPRAMAAAGAQTRRAVEAVASAQPRAAATRADLRTAATAGPDPAPGPLGDRWAEVVQRMAAAGSIGAMVRELALQAECFAVDDDAEMPCWRLRVERENLRAPALRERLQAALAEALQKPVRLEVEAGIAADSPALRDAAEQRRRQAEAEKIIHDDPLVQALMAQYKTARIVPGSVKPL